MSYSYDVRLGLHQCERMQLWACYCQLHAGLKLCSLYAIQTIKMRIHEDNE